jgi:hypothetical protein
MPCNIYTTDPQNLLLHVSALFGCHNQGVFTVVKVVRDYRTTVTTMKTP